MATGVDPIELLSDVDMFSGLDRDTLARVHAAMRPTRHTPGQLIFSRGDAGDDMHVIIKGRVKVSVLTADGREVAFKHIEDGGVFGEIAMLDGRPRTADVTALTTVETLALSSSAAHELIATSPALAQSTIHFVCDRLRQADAQIEAIALHRIEVRLARYLHALCLQAEGADAERATIKLATSQGEIALLLGASRPKVNGALAALEDVGLIERRGTSIVCDVEGLADMAEIDPAD